MTESQATRRNPYLGIDCPPWCEMDHSKAAPGSCVGSGSTGMVLGDVWTRAVIGDRGPKVAVDGVVPGDMTRSAYVSVGTGEAEQLATFVELLADMAPADVLALAAGIRKAAADITGTSDD